MLNLTHLKVAGSVGVLVLVGLVFQNCAPMRQFDDAGVFQNSKALSESDISAGITENGSAEANSTGDSGQNSGNGGEESEEPEDRAEMSQGSGDHSDMDSEDQAEDQAGLENGEIESSDNGDGKDEFRLACGDLGAKYKWHLVSAQIQGSNLAMPQRNHFRIRIRPHKVKKPLVCAGDCGRVYRLKIRSVSGRLRTELSCKFNEQSGKIETRIWTKYDEAKILKMLNGGTEKKLVAQVISRLAGRVNFGFSPDRKTMMMTTEKNDVYKFERQDHKSQDHK